MMRGNLRRWQTVNPGEVFMCARLKLRCNFTDRSTIWHTVSGTIAGHARPIWEVVINIR